MRYTAQESLIRRDTAKQIKHVRAILRAHGYLQPKRKPVSEVQRVRQEGRFQPMGRRINSYRHFIGQICIILALMAGNAYGQTVSAERLANAIYKAENRKTWPYGIKHHYKHTSPRQACLNTIARRLRSWNGKGDFVVYLGKTYSPPSINPNWVRLVHWELEHQRKGIQ